MPKRNVKVDNSRKKMRPALTPEARENQMIALAYDEAEYQILNHTASPGVIVHFLKLGTEKTKLEHEKLKNENLLLAAKTEAIESEKESQALYADVLRAIKVYSGADQSDGEDNDENFRF